jgi:ABC-type sulfate transport system permease component
MLSVLGLLIGVTYAIASAWIVGNDGSRLSLAVRAIMALVFTGPPLVAGILFLLHHPRVASNRAGVG